MNVNRWRAMSVALVAGFMTLLDVSIVNVALPSIRTDLHLSSGGLQWVLSGYALTFGLLLIPAGRYGDARGRRGAFIAGVLVFTLASAAAGLAGNAVWLVIARLVQGAAAGVVNPQVSGLIQQMFAPRERGRPFGLLGATIGVSTAIGPLLGGLLIAGFGATSGWRWIFYINLPIGIVAMILAFLWIPGAPAADARASGSGPVDDSAPASGSPAARPSSPPGKSGKSGISDLDPVGVLLLGAGVLLLLLPLVQEREWHGNLKWLLVVAAIAVLGVFAGWERGYRRTPVVDLGLFKVRSYALGSLVGLLYFAGFTTIFFIYTLFLQSGLHYSALEAGLAVTPFAVGSAVASAVGGRIVERFGRVLVVAGLATVAAGLAAVEIVLHYAPGGPVGWTLALPLLVAGVGSGLVISPNQTLALSEVPVSRAGSAGAVLQTGQRIGTATGIAAVGALFFASLARSHGSWGLAFRTGLWVTLGFVLIALVAGLVDMRARATRRT